MTTNDFDLEEAKSLIEKVRRVRTAAGAKKYGVPIGSPIVAGKAVDSITRAARAFGGGPGTIASAKRRRAAPDRVWDGRKRSGKDELRLAGIRRDRRAARGSNADITRAPRSRGKGKDVIANAQRRRGMNVTHEYKSSEMSMGSKGRVKFGNRSQSAYVRGSVTSNGENKFMMITDDGTEFNVSALDSEGVKFLRAAQNNAAPKNVRAAMALKK